MEGLLARQQEIINQLERVGVNFDKDSASRKTPEYISKRLETLDSLWGEFDSNNDQLAACDVKNQQYFTENIFDKTKQYYQGIRSKISSYGSGGDDHENSKIGDLLSQQRTCFRAFQRLIKSISVDELTEKWEIEDELRNVQSLWNSIDSKHLDIDNILQGRDIIYDEEFMKHEKAYKIIKRQLNQKLCSTAHKQQCTPQLEIPVFTGAYTHWPTFFDLFSEAIHNNTSLSKAQKMQHLKGKLKGEAERLIQHLNISTDNYDTAWDILTHRYNNPHILFTKQIEIFLEQPVINKQTSSELKRLYDTTMESIHAIHNLGVDTTTWDPLLVHLISKKLDAQTYADYKEARKSPRDLPSFDELMSFVESKFVALEPIRKEDRGRTSISPSKPSVSQGYQKPSFLRQNNNDIRNPYKRHQAMFASSHAKCPVCSKNHEIYRCKKFIGLRDDQKLSTVAKLKICPNCLHKHVDKCISTKRCKECNDEHNTLLHTAYAESKSTPSRSTPTLQTPNISANNGNKNHSVNHVATDDEEVLLTTLLLKIRSADGSYVTLRALLDQGSQVSLISENATQMLGLRRKNYHASVSGIGITPKQGRGIVALECKSIYNDYEFATQALVISQVISNLPNNSFKRQSWEHLQNINLADPDYNISKPVDILLDASVYSDIIMSGLIKGVGTAPIAQQTKLGWVLSGNVRTFNCNVVINNLQEIAKYWEIEDISSTTSELTREEQYCEEFYQATTRRLEDGKYEVALPMKQNYEQNLGASKGKALAQFRQLETRMSKNEDLANSYKQFMTEYEQLGHMRLAVDIQEPACYLPHHGILKLESTTTKFRTVFNASSKTASGHSLNDLMECGPNLQHDLQALILSWRKHKYVMTADIEKMFRQLMVRKDDINLQTIIWRYSPNEPLKEYNLTTVTYGTKAAPYLAMRTLRQLAQDDGEKYPLAAIALNSSFFMDDLMTGEDTIEQALELRNQLISILKGAGMNLRKWSANSSDLIKDLANDQIDSPFDFKCADTRKTLGLRWNPSSDTFTFKNKIDQYQDGTTKRQLLSNISKIYDPLGWLSPVSIKAKLLFQKAWSSSSMWDEKLSMDIQQQWQDIRNDLNNIEQLSIPRYLGNTKKQFYMYGFCDASEKAYACAIYIVAKNDNEEYASTLVTAKTKLAPLNKKLSLPRLELCGALLLAQLMSKVRQSITHRNVYMHAWSDSMIVLGWIQGDITRWKQFVSNRVLKINESIPASQWHHVRSEDNPADCATRGTTAADLVRNSLWWEGPRWLLGFHNNPIPNIKFENPKIELKSSKVNVALQTYNIIIELLHNMSSLTRLINTIAWISRFITRLRHKQTTSGLTISALEQQNALVAIIRTVQTYDFKDDLIRLKHKGQVHLSSKLAPLNPFIDEQGLIRVGGRLKHANISSSAKHPIIMSSHSRLTELIIEQYHKQTLHGGPQLTLSHIRQKYWIISGMRTVKRELRRCVTCRRYNSAKHHQIMADLPLPRVTISRPFTHTGVDFTGHVDVRTSKGRGTKSYKGYVAVFVCLATKAIHLELVSDLSTPAFLAAFQRFVARRGTPSNMYSDNGTNFVGANRIMKQEYRAIVQTINQDFFSNITDMNIIWHFNAPAWPSAGGLWEAAVKSFKRHLKRVLGEQKLTYEEFTTLLYRIEACLNSRPLTPLTENPEDEFLTPAHFLVGGPLLSRPLTEPENISLPARWQLLQSMNKQFWKKWSVDYLQTLQVRSKWRTPTKNLEVNDVVLIMEDNLPPGKWALGRVLEVHPGKDGYVRVVSLKTQNSIMKRPISKLVPLLPNEQIDQPCLTSNTNNQPQQQNQNSPNHRPNRNNRRKPSSFKNFFLSTLLLLMMSFTTTYSAATQQTVPTLNVTSLSSNQGLYFDKISDMQHIRDEWKLIVYYDLTNYWHGISYIEKYIKHLKPICSGTYYNSIVTQLEHELKEIEHYNSILVYQNKGRSKRGLIDGIGNIANSLFGVLDSRFAERYENDIKQITSNENHLQALIRNQTIIIEAQNNIIQRNEKIMNEQFAQMNLLIKQQASEIARQRVEYQNSMYVTSSVLSANIIIDKLRRIQQTLIDTVTDITHGRVDAHLLSPEQLETQLNIISGHLEGNLRLPVEKSDTRDIYKLLRVFARATRNYMLMEVRVPLVSIETYELDKIVSIPQNSSITNMFDVIIPNYPYIAFNLQKDTAIFLSDVDLRSALHSENKILLSINKPIYELKIKQPICSVELININNSTSLCRYDRIACNDKWIKLHRQNVWLFTCCQECKVRVFCPDGMTMTALTGAGLITLRQGCSLKTDSFTIYASNNFLSKVHIDESIDLPEMEISMLNKIINTTVPEFKLLTEHHDQTFKELNEQIQDLKTQSTSEFTIHDLHHYTISYTLVAVIAIAAIIATICRLRKKRSHQRSAQTPPAPPEGSSSSNDLQVVSSDNKGTAVSFKVPKISE